MNKSVVLTIVFFVGLVAIVLFMTLGSAAVTCEICMTYQGRKGCKTVSGETKEMVTQTARDNICAEISGGRDDMMTCSHQEIASISCQGSFGE